MKFFELEEAIILEASGRDSVRYLNARLTNDIKNLKVGSACLAGMLTSHGRTQGLFSVYRLAESSFILWCDGGNTTEVITALKQFMVADRVEVKDISGEHACIHCLAEQDFNLNAKSISIPKSELQATTIEDKSYGISRKRSTVLGIDLIIPKAKVAETKHSLAQQGGKELNRDQYTLLRISAGIPSYPEELADLLFIEADMPHAISFKKGCYVGQEVMEKIDSHGKSPRVIRGIKLAGLVSVDAESEVLTTGTKSISGKILSCSIDPENACTYCLVSFKNQPGLNEAVGVTFQGKEGRLIS